MPTIDPFVAARAGIDDLAGYSLALLAVVIGAELFELLIRGVPLGLHLNEPARHMVATTLWWKLASQTIARLSPDERKRLVATLTANGDLRSAP